MPIALLLILTLPTEEDGWTQVWPVPGFPAAVPADFPGKFWGTAPGPVKSAKTRFLVHCPLGYNNGNGMDVRGGVAVSEAVWLGPGAHGPWSTFFDWTSTVHIPEDANLTWNNTPLEVSRPLVLGMWYKSAIEIAEVTGGAFTTIKSLKGNLVEYPPQ